MLSKTSERPEKRDFNHLLPGQSACTGLETATQIGTFRKNSLASNKESIVCLSFALCQHISIRALE